MVIFVKEIENGVKGRKVIKIEREKKGTPTGTSFFLGELVNEDGNS